MSAALVSTEWLQAHLADPNLHVVDASWSMVRTPGETRADFEAAHIPGAQFFDIEALSDHATPLPHMMPRPQDFAAGMSALGIGDDAFVVTYDTAGLYSAPRAWWMLRAMGHDKVAVLDGGLPKWRRENRPVEQGPGTVVQARFTARPRPALVRDFETMQLNLQSRAEQVVDARSPARFRAEEPEPRPGLRSGHMPGSRNVHYAEVVAPDGTLKPPAELRRVFAEHGVDLARPTVTSCGSGITAAIVLLALDVAGAKEAALYDGSWAEWGSRAEASVVTGAP